MSTEQPAPAPEIADLRARIAELEARNRELAAHADADPGPRPPTARRWRALLAAVLIAAGAVFAPIALVTTWTLGALVDTDRFVAAAAPVVRVPAVQDYLGDQVVAAIESRIDIDGLVSDLVDGLGSLVADRPLTAAALPLLKASAAEGIRAQIVRATDEVVTSEAFASTWEQTLRISHTQAIGALNGDPQVAATITADGLGLQLGPIVDRVRAQLTEQGSALARFIPDVDRTVVLVRTSDLAQVQAWYRFGVAVGSWLPWVSLALLGSGVLVANRRRSALLGAGLGVAGAGGVVLAGLAIVRTVLPTFVPESVMPSNVLEILYETVTASLSDTVMTLVVLGVVVAVLCWWRGPSRGATWLRTGWQRTSEAIRAGRDAHGLDTGRFGAWMLRRRVWVTMAVVAAAVTFLLANRPLSGGTIVGTTLVALGVLALGQLLEARSGDLSSS